MNLAHPLRLPGIPLVLKTLDNLVAPTKRMFFLLNHILEDYLAPNCRMMMNQTLLLYLSSNDKVLNYLKSYINRLGETYQKFTLHLKINENCDVFKIGLKALYATKIGASGEAAFIFFI